MLRVALSVHTGRLLPSAVLRRLATYSRKNRLYFAFCSAVSAVELRRAIGAATNKSELFNRYAQWVAFGSSGLATAAERDEQRKMVKYNHLVANLLIFHTVVGMTRALELGARRRSALHSFLHGRRPGRGARCARGRYGQDRRHGFGASVAWNAAMMRPDRFTAVFCLSVPFLPLGDPSFLQQLREAGRDDFYMFRQMRPEAEAEWAMPSRRSRACTTGHRDRRRTTSAGTRSTLPLA